MTAVQRPEAVESRAAHSQRLFAAACVVLALGLFLWEGSERTPQIDDAYISYRYAQNLALGNGLVFNIGERVEGITNLGYTLAVALGIGAGFKAETTSHALGLASGVALLWLSFALAQCGLSRERRWLAGFAPLCVLASTPFAAWALSGLETPMFAAFSTAAFLAFARDRPGWAATAAAGATLMRPEGVLIAAAVFAGPLARALMLARTPARLFAARELWVAPVFFALFVLSLTAFRLAYYGSPVPNTFYAKIGGIPLARGLGYVANFWRDGSMFLLLPIALALPRSGGARLQTGFALLLSVYAVLVGGDAFHHGRFLLPALPLLAAAAVSGVDATWRANPNFGLLLATTLLAAILWPLFGAASTSVLAGAALAGASFTPFAKVHPGWMRSGLLLLAALALAVGIRWGGGAAVFRFVEPERRTAARHENFLPDNVVRRQARFVRDAQPELVATVAIGRMGFWSGVPILDVLGLCDEHIARSENRNARGGLLVPGHQRSDADYVLSRRPGFIFMLRRNTRNRNTQLPAVLDLWDDPRLERDYEYVDEIFAYRLRPGVSTAADDYGDGYDYDADASVLNDTPLFYRPVEDTGRWREFGTHKFDEALTREQREMIEQLEAIGYVSGSRDAPTDGARGTPSGVVVNDASRASPGFNFYTSGHAPEAILTDVAGRELHRWQYDFWDAWPDFPVAKTHASTEFWRRTLLQPDGSLLAIHEGLGLLKLDAESNLLWALPNRAHHDLAVVDSGEIWVLTREAHLVPRIHEDLPIIEDFVERLGADGTQLGRFSLLEAFEGTEFAPLVDKVKGRHGDIFHTNSLAVLERDLPNPPFQKGRLLLYMLGVGLTVVVDAETEKVVWARFGRPERSHDPKITAGNNLLLFENKFREEESRIVEYAGTTKIPVWSYQGTPERPFYSETCGTVDRLPNGNTLITETDAGHAFETTPEKEIVWEFWNPHRAGPEGRYIASLFELVRLPPSFPTSWAHQTDRAAASEGAAASEAPRPVKRAAASEKRRGQ